MTLWTTLRDHARAAAPEAESCLPDRPDNNTPLELHYHALTAHEGVKRRVAVWGNAKLVEHLQSL